MSSTLFCCASDGALRLPAEVGGLAVVPVGPEVAELVEAIRRSGASRWLLVGYADGLDVIAEVAAQVLAGTAPVFGLAGVVLVGGGGSDEPGVPTLRTTPEAAAEDIARFWTTFAGRGPEVPADYAAMLASGRVTSRTRAINARRALADDPDHAPAALTPDALAVLRVVADHLVPQDGDPAARVDLAARVDTQLARGEGDGWRYADQPPDVEAYRAALAELADLPGLPGAEQAARLSGDLSTFLEQWLEDACVDLVRHWLAHPANLARAGFDGMASGGDDGLVGFELVGADEREAWEPAMEAPR